MSPEDVKPRRDPEGHARFEQLLLELSSRFVNLPPDDVDRAIEDALGRVCEFLDIDFAVLWQWSAAAPGVITPTHSFPAQEDLLARSCGPPPQASRQTHLDQRQR